MKYGVIDVGGGLRGIYGAGVLETAAWRRTSASISASAFRRAAPI